MNILETLLGQLPEALFFALFIILSKQIKTKRILFIILMSLEYILLLHIFSYSIWSRVLYFIVSYIILKMLYEEKSQITDIFTIGIASIFMMIINIPVFFIFSSFGYIIAILIDRVLMFLALYLLRNKLPKIQNLYKNLWNRNDKIPKHIKSTTFRCLNLVIFNITFYLLNIIIIYCLIIRR